MYFWSASADKRSDDTIVTIIIHSQLHITFVLKLTSVGLGYKG